MEKFDSRQQIHSLNISIQTVARVVGFRLSTVTFVDLIIPVKKFFHGFNHPQKIFNHEYFPEYGKYFIVSSSSASSSAYIRFGFF